MLQHTKYFNGHKDSHWDDSDNEDEVTSKGKTKSSTTIKKIGDTEAKRNLEAFFKNKFADKTEENPATTSLNSEEVIITAGNNIPTAGEYRNSKLTPNHDGALRKKSIDDSAVAATPAVTPNTSTATSSATSKTRKAVKTTTTKKKTTPIAEENFNLGDLFVEVKI
ncbi:MAG: hypothetical protein RCG15_04340 [Candidatus Rickettsia vulgarisii]